MLLLLLLLLMIICFWPRAALGSASVTVQASPFGETLMLHNNTAAVFIVSADTASLGLWVCLSDTRPPPACASRDDSPTQPRQKSKPPCVYVTPACECIQWQPFGLSASGPGWALGDGEGECARVVYHHNQTLSGTIRRQQGPVTASLTIDWELEAVGRVPSRSAMQMGPPMYGLATSMANACALSASSPLALSAGRAWGCRRSVTMGVRVYTRA